VSIEEVGDHLDDGVVLAPGDPSGVSSGRRSPRRGRLPGGVGTRYAPVRRP